jgi:2-polyprenyl-3-methyl-5-hydroxy-6-metoxy-1,4-benzoquinol methylase
MEHVSEIKEILDAMWERVLPNGRLIIAVPSWDSFLRFAHESIMNIPPHHLSLWEDAVFEYIKTSLGAKSFTVIHEEPAEFHRSWVQAEISFKYLRKILNRKKGLIYDRKFDALIWKFSLILAKFIPIRSTNVGHTVIGIFHKNA